MPDRDLKERETACDVRGNVRVITEGRCLMIDAEELL